MEGQKKVPPGKWWKDDLEPCVKIRVDTVSQFSLPPDRPRTVHILESVNRGESILYVPGRVISEREYRENIQRLGKDAIWRLSIGKTIVYKVPPENCLASLINSSSFAPEGSKKASTSKVVQANCECRSDHNLTPLDDKYLRIVASRNISVEDGGSVELVLDSYNLCDSDFYCDICKTSFQRKYNRAQHMKSHPATLECVYCKKKFATVGNLRRHLTASAGSSGHPKVKRRYENPASNTHLSYMLEKIPSSEDPLLSRDFARDISVPCVFNPNNVYSLYNTKSSANKYFEELNTLASSKGFEWIYFTQSAADAAERLPALAEYCRSNWPKPRDRKRKLEVTEISPVILTTGTSSTSSSSSDHRAGGGSGEGKPAIGVEAGEDDADSGSGADEEKRRIGGGRVWYIHGMYLASAGRAGYHSSIIPVADEASPTEVNDVFVPVFPPTDEQGVMSHMAFLRGQAQELGVMAFYFEAYIAGKAMYSPLPTWWEKMYALCQELRIVMVADESLLGWYVTGSQWSFQRLGYTFEPHFIVVSKIVMPGILLNLRSPQAFGSVKKCFLGSTTAGPTAAVIIQMRWELKEHFNKATADRMLACGKVIEDYLRAQEKELGDRLPTDYVHSRGVGGAWYVGACLRPHVSLGPNRRMLLNTTVTPDELKRQLVEENWPKDNVNCTLCGFFAGKGSGYRTCTRKGCKQLWHLDCICGPKIPKSNSFVCPLHTKEEELKEYHSLFLHKFLYLAPPRFLDYRRFSVRHFLPDSISAHWIGFREAAALEFGKAGSLGPEDLLDQTIHFRLSYAHDSLLVAIASIVYLDDPFFGPMFRLDNVFVQRLWRGEDKILGKLVSYIQSHVQTQTQAMGYLIDSGQSEPWFPRLINSCIPDPKKRTWYWIAPAMN